MYTYRIFDSIDDVDLADWERLRSECGRSIFMDPRFIAAAETSMKATCRCWYVIVYDADLRPVASACLFAMTVDLADVAHRGLARVIRHAPAALSKLAKWNVLVCCLPGLPGEKTLALSPREDSRLILPLLDQAMLAVAERAKANVIACKEFPIEDLQRMAPMLELGYRQIPTPATHYFEAAFRDLAHYSAALRYKYRWNLKVSRRKLECGSIRTSVLTDPEQILKAFTPEVHALYYEMAARADLKLEILPIDFFHQVTLRLPGAVDLVTLSKDSKVIAFAWCLSDGTIYHALYGGLDYRLNRQFDLYFNLVYACLDRALQRRVSKICLGQSANAFKARIGCQPAPLYAFAKGVGPVMSRVVRYGASMLVAEVPARPPHDIFRKPGAVPR
jgi:predicted N-acyltransferase